jgi:molybdopterin-biosynthesis enzyme MoeA-like protein
MGNLEAQGVRSVVVGRDVINSIIITGDHNKVFVGKYETLRVAYINPKEVFDRVDLDHFVGREWLVDMIDSFISNHDRGYFILEAGAGFGKSTFMAWLVQKRGYIHNFCELTPGLENIGNALKSLSSQIALAYDLSTEGVLPADAASMPDFLYDMLVKAAEKRRDKEKIVLVIDALDQAGTPKGQNVLGLPKSLPEGVFIIASQRPVKVMLSTDKATTPCVVCRLSDYKEKHEDDIRRFLYEATTRPKISAFLQDHSYTSDKFVTTLMEKCQSVWVYLSFVIPQIESNECLTLDLNSLPEGLLNYYIDYWSRWREDYQLQWYESYLPLLSTLAATQESVSVKILATWISSKMPEQMLGRLLKEQWRPYMIVSLYGKEERYRFYHQSLQDFFSGRVEQNNLCTAEEAFLDELKEATLEAHNRLVELYLTAWGGLNIGLPGLQNPENLTIDDGYGLRYLASHLEAAGRVDDLHHLLSLETTEQRNAWYEVKDAYGTVADYMIDVTRAWQLAEHASESKIKKGEIAPTIGMETRYALISASVNSLSASIPPELLVVLVEKGIWTFNKGMAYVRQIPNWKQRMKLLILIIPELPKSQLLESQREEILKGALNAAKQIQDESERAEALVGLAPHLPESMMKEALDAAKQIQNESERAEALVGLAPHLPESMMKELLDAAIQISYGCHWGNGLNQIKHQYYRTVTLVKIAPYLPESMMKEAFDAAIQIQDEYYRAEALVKMAPYLPESMMKEALDVAIQIQCQSDRAIALVGLVPHLPESMIKKVLDAAIQIQDEWSRAKALVGIAPHLHESMMKKALDATIQIQNESKRVEALAGIAPYLPESMMKKALNIATQFQDESERIKVLVGIAPYLPESMMKEVLDEAIQNQDEHYRTEILAGIAPHLPESMMKELLDAAIQIPYGCHWGDGLNQIKYQYYRTVTLVKIAPYLPESMMKEAFDAAIQIQDEYYRAEALVKMAPYLPESMMKEALDVAIQIRCQSYRAIALVGLVSQQFNYGT